jgi:(1->4)-alpha-D-glucan 1-alpha-D-glucosylmutase
LQIFVQRIALLGAFNSLAQLTLKATLPGVPDFYQGTELWDLSLVDPDNRRPVDFAARANLLATVEQPDWSALAQNWTDGRIKLAWTRHLLRLRGELADVFTQGDYEPLEVTGPHCDHVIAFARRHGRKAAIVAVGRSLAPLSAGGRNWPRAEAWQASVVAPGYRVDDTRAASDLPLASLFEHLPVVVRRARVLGATRARQTGQRKT